MKPAAAQRERDRVHMARCLELAERYRGRTSPNPIVGCVIVDRRGKVIAEGAHAGPGKAHAEVAALAKLGGKAAGATLYVNLEPCNHHGRTPPCAPVVRDAGVARVVIGMADPIEGHGGGIAVLRRAKLAVTVGVLREACEAANRPFSISATRGRPAFTLKAAVTLDGKIATVSGDSKWITGEAARADVMRLRDTHDAVLVGIGTVLADDPQLTARAKGARDPRRIVIDRQLRTPVDARVLPAIIATTMEAPVPAELALVARGAEVWRLPAFPTGPHAGRIDLGMLAGRLHAAGIQSVLVEGGGEVHASCLAHGLADQLVLYIAPKIVGGPAKSWVGGDGLASLAAAYGFTFTGEPVRIGADIRLTAEARRAAEPVRRKA